MVELNAIGQYIADYWASFLVILVALAALLIAWKAGYKKQVVFVLRRLVAEAEKAYGSKTGKIKKAAVLAAIYSYLPAILRPFFPPAVMDELIEDALKWMKSELEKADANLLGTMEEAVVDAAFESLKPPRITVNITGKPEIEKTE